MTASAWTSSRIEALIHPARHLHTTRSVMIRRSGCARCRCFTDEPNLDHAVVTSPALQKQELVVEVMVDVVTLLEEEEGEEGH